MFRRVSPRVVTRALGPKLQTVATAISGAPFATYLAKDGFDEVHFGKQAIGWLDPKHRRGVVYTTEGALLAYVRDGKPMSAFGRKVPPHLGRALREIRAAEPRVASLEVVHVRTVESLAGAKRLPALERAQLAAASRELCGKPGLEAVFREAAQRELVYARFLPRFDAWLWSSLDDGVFFVRGKRALSGIAVSQGRVHDMTGDRDGDVKALQAALKTLRVGRRSMGPRVVHRAVRGL